MRAKGLAFGRCSCVHGRVRTQACEVSVHRARDVAMALAGTGVAISRQRQAARTGRGRQRGPSRSRTGSRANYSGFIGGARLTPAAQGKVEGDGMEAYRLRLGTARAMQGRGIAVTSRSRAGSAGTSTSSIGVLARRRRPPAAALRLLLGGVVVASSSSLGPAASDTGGGGVQRAAAPSSSPSFFFLLLLLFLPFSSVLQERR
jgi:hypothetical protein